MRAQSFTIHTELIDGSLDGARNIYMGANSTCHLYVIPRQEISLANTLSDIAGQPAFYILLGHCDSSKPKAYIGQTTDFANRKNDHLQKKDWWDMALIFISDNHKIYGDDVRFLEYLGIKAAQEAGSHELFNGLNPKKPNIASYRINDMEVFFRDIELLAKFYGCRIFESPVSSLNVLQRHLFYVKIVDRPAYGIGYYDETNGTFVIMKGSRLASQIVPSYKSASRRDRFIEEHCKIIDNAIILQHDVIVESPSGASGIVLGRPSNGWKDWIDSEGRNLGNIYNH